MKRTVLLQEIRMARFEEAFGDWTEKRLTQEEAARLLGVCPRTFRRYVDRYHEDGIDGLVDKRMSQVSSRRALADEGRRRGKRRKKRERAPLPGMLVHQDGSTHEWVAGATWDLIVTLDDATGEACSGFFVAEEGAWSSFRGVRETAESRGLFPSFHSDRGSPRRLGRHLADGTPVDAPA